RSRSLSSTAPPATAVYTLSLHDALPISRAHGRGDPCASGTPGLHSRPLSRSAFMVVVCRQRGPVAPRAMIVGGGIGMAEDDPSRESPGLGPELGQRFFGFDEDISGVAVPAELPILPLRGVVIFPSAIVPLLISRGASLRLVEECLAGDRMLGLAAQKNAEEESPAPEGLYSRGTAGRILKMLKYPDQSVRILVQGLRRIEIVAFTG